MGYALYTGMMNDAEQKLYLIAKFVCHARLRELDGLHRLATEYPKRVTNKNRAKAQEVAIHASQDACSANRFWLEVIVLLLEKD